VLKFWKKQLLQGRMLRNVPSGSRLKFSVTSSRPSTRIHALQRTRNSSFRPTVARLEMVEIPQKRPLSPRRQERHGPGFPSWILVERSQKPHQLKMGHFIIANIACKATSYCKVARHPSTCGRGCPLGDAGIRVSRCQSPGPRIKAMPNA
jgi:hypothetical protein